MRFVEDKELSFCMTISSGIEREALLDILGWVDLLPQLQTFDDTAWDTKKTAGRTGILNVFEEGDFLITLEKDGYSGVRHSTVLKVAEMMAGKVGHYICLFRVAGQDGYQYYVEVQDGMVLSGFDPETDPIPTVVEEFFQDGDPMANMIKAAEYRLETVVKPEWLEQPTDTYVIEYKFTRN
jgi:hypothetical protein